VARPIFWPTQDSYVLSIGGYPNAGIQVRIWTRQTGGTQVTDLVYVAPDGTIGSAVPSGILVSDSNGLIPAFAGPDNGPTTLWGNHGLSGELLALTSGPGAGGGGAVTYGTTSGTAAEGNDARIVNAISSAAAAAAYGPAIGSDAWLIAEVGGQLDAMLTGAYTRNEAGALTAAGVIWRDGATGSYAGTASITFPSKIDTFTVTRTGSPTKTVTQPAYTRDPSTGAITNRPQMTVS
jgi:hypothetical protein